MGEGMGNLFTCTPFFLVSCWTPGLLTLSYKLSTWGTLIHPLYLLQRDRVRILAGRPDLHCATLPILCSSPALQPVVPPHSWSAQMGPRPKYRSRLEELQWSSWALSRIGQLAHSPLRSDLEDRVQYGRLLARMQPHSCGVLTSITTGVAKLTRFPSFQKSYETQKYKSLWALRHPAKMEVTRRLLIWAALVASCGAQLMSTVAEGKKWNQILQFKHWRPAFTSGPLPKPRKLSYLLPSIQRITHLGAIWKSCVLVVMSLLPMWLCSLK